MKKRYSVLALLAFACAAPGIPLHAGPDAVRPAKGKALICFYREVAFEGNLFRYTVNDGDRSVGSLPAESFLYYETTPGNHRFEVGLLRHGATDLHVQRGHIYYLRCLPAAEVFYAKPQLELVPVVEGAAVVATLRPGHEAH